MTKAALYINAKGYAVTRHSYSGSERFHYCPRAYKLERIDGWKEKERRASRLFGIALENALRWHHDNALSGGAEEFDKQWAPLEKDNTLTFTAKEVSWEALAKTGHELMQLYAVRLADFPFEPNDIQFQLEYRKEMYPGSDLAGIEFMAYVDMIAKLKNGLGKVGIDCKTSSTHIPDYIMLDPQLKSYAYVSGFLYWAFLWFEKCGRTIEKGSEVSFLADGSTGVVLAEGDDTLGPTGFWVTKNLAIEDEMGRLFKGSAKAVKAARQAFIEQHATLVPENLLTRQKVSFRMTTITPEAAADMGETIGRDIVQIVNANNENFFPMLGGVRYPNEKCPKCVMRGICSGDAELRDKLLERETADIDLGLKDAD